MKKIVQFIILCSFIFLFTHTASAQEIERAAIQAKIASTTANMYAQKEAIEEKIASTTTHIQDKRDELSSDIEKRIGKKLDAPRTVIAEKFEDVLKTLNTLVTRTQAQIIKNQATETDITSLNALLTTTQLNINTAEADLTTLENMLAEPLGTSTRKTAIANLQNQSNTTKSDIETAYASFMSIFRTLTATGTTTQIPKPREHADISGQSTTTQK